MTNLHPIFAQIVRPWIPPEFPPLSLTDEQIKSREHHREEWDRGDDGLPEDYEGGNDE